MTHSLASLKRDPFLLWAAKDLMSRGTSESEAVQIVINTYVRSNK